jgi:hypothetical protein
MRSRGSGSGANISSFPDSSRHARLSPPRPPCDAPSLWPPRRPRSSSPPRRGPRR